MKHLLFFTALLLLFSFGAVRAQKQGQALVDSLVQELPKAKNDSATVRICSALSLNYSNINPDAGLKFGLQGLALAQRMAWKKAIAMVSNNIGIDYRTKSDFQTALDYFFKALKMNEESGNKSWMIRNLGNIGIIYNDQDDGPKALEYMFKALKLSEETGDSYSAGLNLANIATIYFKKEDYSMALQYMFKALNLQEKQEDKEGIAITLGNIGNVYDKQGNSAKASDYIFRSLKMFEELGDKAEIARTMGNIGNLYARKQNYTSALEFDYKAIKIDEEIGNKNNLAEHLGETGEHYLNIACNTTGTIKPGLLIPAGKTAKLQKAIAYLNRSVLFCTEVGNVTGLKEYSKALSKAQEVAGNYKGALESYKQFVTAKDSVSNTENNIKITNLETQRNLDLKDRDIEIKNKQIEVERLAVAKKRNERGFFIVGIFVLIIVAFIIFRNYKKLSAHKNEIEKLRAVSDERIRIASDMHDELGSGLTSIRMLSEIAVGKIDHAVTAKPEIEKIEKSAANLSENLREIIWTMNTRFDKLDDFIIYIRSYAVEFFDESPVKFQFTAPDIIPAIILNGELRRNIFLCIKEALNNIMKHAKATEASLTFHVVENSIIIEIKDNGIGIDTTRVNNFGNGLTTMKERLKKFGSDLEMEINGGTKLLFKINV